MQLRANNFLDEIIGPLQPETITTIYGPPGIGKSNISYIYLIEALKIGKKVVFIDTENGFSVERLKQMKPEIKLENVIVFSPRTFDDQQKTVYKLVNGMKDIKNVGLLIFDSLAMLYRLKLGDDPKGINKAFAEQLRLLMEISRQYRIPVLVINQMYYHFETKEKKFIGGSIVDYWSKVIVEVDYDDDNKRFVKLVKHKFREESGPRVFEIIKEGLR